MFLGSNLEAAQHEQADKGKHLYSQITMTLGQRDLRVGNLLSRDVS